MSTFDPSKRFQKVIEIIKERQKSYDAPERNFQRIADGWSGILNIKVTPEQVALCMCYVKLIREAHSHSTDNVDDLIGYSICLAQIVAAKEPEELTLSKDSFIEKLEQYENRKSMGFPYVEEWRPPIYTGNFSYARIEDLDKNKDTK
jgi:hypothetical protein